MNGLMKVKPEHPETKAIACRSVTLVFEAPLRMHPEYREGQLAFSS